jgi:hypothetical protein
MNNLKIAPSSLALCASRDKLIGDRVARTCVRIRWIIMAERVQSKIRLAFNQTIPTIRFPPKVLWCNLGIMSAGYEILRTIILTLALCAR